MSWVRRGRGWVLIATVAVGAAGAWTTAGPSVSRAARSSLRRVATLTAYTVISDRQRYLAADLGAGRVRVFDTLRSRLLRYRIARGCVLWIANGAADGRYGQFLTVNLGSPASGFAVAECAGGKRWVSFSLATGRSSRIAVAVKHNYLPFSIGRTWLSYGACSFLGAPPAPLGCQIQYVNWRTGARRTPKGSYPDLDSSDLASPRSYPIDNRGTLVVHLASGQRLPILHCDPTCDQVGFAGDHLVWRQNGNQFAFGGSYDLGTRHIQRYRFALPHGSYFGRYTINNASTASAFVVAQLVQPTTDASQCISPNFASSVCHDRYAILAKNW